MKSNSLLFIGQGERSAQIFRDAVQIIAPDVRVREVATLEEALVAAEAPGLELAVFLDPPMSAVAEAAKAVDTAFLPRWGVIAVGAVSGVPGALGIPSNEWTVALATRIIPLCFANLQLRRESERLRGDLQAIGTRITHDLRTPLGGIFAATEALSEYVAPRDPTAAERAAGIMQSAEDILKQIRRLTLIAKEFARAPVFTKFSMGTPVRTALERLERRIIQSKAEILEPAAWPDVTADRSMVENMWASLLENALVHGGPGVRIALGWELRDTGTRFFVQDNGPGVPEGKRPGLFQPFNRLNQPNAARGVGLAIVGRLAGLQGGTCGFEPSAGGGATFSFNLLS